MRRSVMYLAGLLLATGASLALAGPASAAPSHHCDKGHHADVWYSAYSDDDSYSVDYNNAQNNGSEYNGIVLLSGNSDNGGLGILGLL